MVYSPRRHFPRGAPMPSSHAPAELTTAEAEPVPLHLAYRVCEDIARTHYENFPVASRFIPADRRIALAAIYAFARQADDVADAAAPSEDRLRALDAIEEAFLRALDGAPQGPVLTALADAVDRHRLPAEPFLDLLGAFRMDARDATFPTWDDLLRYCRGSANPVGRLVLAVYGIEEPEAHRRPTRSAPRSSSRTSGRTWGRTWRGGAISSPWRTSRTSV